MRSRDYIGLGLAGFFMLASGVANAALSGKTIASDGNGHGAPACSSCHGADGAGNADAGFPRLAGQPAGYLEKQLRDYASGARSNAIMQSMAKALTAEEISAVAGYYSGLQTAGGDKVTAGDKKLAIGRELAVNGDWHDDVPSCEGCHGPGARGVSPHFPALAGQHADYIESQLKAWQAGKRSNDPDDLMASVSKGLSDDQAHAAAVYLASLSPLGGGNSGTDEDIDVAPANVDAAQGYFQAPTRSDLPKGEFGASVRRGERIFTDTTHHAPDYVGNGLDCSNCHVNKGRQARSAPLWAAWVLYPKFRGKNHHVNTMDERIRGCFTYSENAQASRAGHAPEPNSQVLVDLQSYMFWLATGAPTGRKMKGQGYPTLKRPARAYDPKRGARVFADNCALCHGDHGQGTKVGDAYVFPPLWGASSFNWGAGMHRVNTAAGFIKANMPYGRANSLTDQQAWDVAAFVDSQQRPQDPRFNGDVSATAKKYHKKADYYGEKVDGRVLGARPPAGKPVVGPQ